MPILCTTNRKFYHIRTFVCLSCFPAPITLIEPSWVTTLMSRGLYIIISFFFFKENKLSCHPPEQQNLLAASLPVGARPDTWLSYPFTPRGLACFGDFPVSNPGCSYSEPRCHIHRTEQTLPMHLRLQWWLWRPHQPSISGTWCVWGAWELTLQSLKRKGQTGLAQNPLWNSCSGEWEK